MPTDADPRDRAQLVESWSAHAQLVFAHYGFEATPEAILVFAERIADESIAYMHESDKLRDRHREQARIRTAICTEIAGGRSRAEAARIAGISAETFYRWQRDDPSFRLAVRDALRQRQSARPGASRRAFKMTPSVRTILLQRLSDGMTRAQAAASVGVSRQTLYAWLRKAPEFAAAVVRAEDTAAAVRASG
jgi:transposase